jgi:DNA-binding response OmpR family regulator
MNTAQIQHVSETMVPPHILVMEDEPSVAHGVQTILTEEGYGVDLAMTGRAALDTFERDRYDLLVADLRLPDIDGMEVIKKVKTVRPETEVIIITGYSSVNSAVEAIKVGVHDYLAKPFTDDQLIAAVHGALEEKVETPVEAPPLDFDSEEGRLIQKREVIQVLDRTAEDGEFFRDLMEKGSEMLADYRLSPEAQAAIVSGDLNWINEHVGELTQKQLVFIYKRLEREAW